MLLSSTELAVWHADKVSVEVLFYRFPDRETEAETSSASFLRPHKKGAPGLGTIPSHLSQQGWTHP